MVSATPTVTGIRNRASMSEAAWRIPSLLRLTRKAAPINAAPAIATVALRISTHHGRSDAPRATGSSLWQ